MRPVPTEGPRARRRLPCGQRRRVCGVGAPATAQARPPYFHPAGACPRTRLLGRRPCQGPTPPQAPQALVTKDKGDPRCAAPCRPGSEHRLSPPRHPEPVASVSVTSQPQRAGPGGGFSSSPREGPQQDARGRGHIQVRLQRREPCGCRWCPPGPSSHRGPFRHDTNPLTDNSSESRPGMAEGEERSAETRGEAAAARRPLPGPCRPGGQ